MLLERLFLNFSHEVISVRRIAHLLSLLSFFILFSSVSAKLLDSCLAQFRDGRLKRYYQLAIVRLRNSSRESKEPGPNIRIIIAAMSVCASGHTSGPEFWKAKISNSLRNLGHWHQHLTSVNRGGYRVYSLTMTDYLC